MSDMKYKLMVSEVEAKKAMKEFADSICKNYNVTYYDGYVKIVTPKITLYRNTEQFKKEMRELFDKEIENFKIGKQIRDEYERNNMQNTAVTE